MATYLSLAQEVVELGLTLILSFLSLVCLLVISAIWYRSIVRIERKPKGKYELMGMIVTHIERTLIIISLRESVRGNLKEYPLSLKDLQNEVERRLKLIEKDVPSDLNLIPHLKALEDDDIIQRIDDGYELSAKGRAVLEELTGE